VPVINPPASRGSCGQNSNSWGPVRVSASLQKKIPRLEANFLALVLGPMALASKVQALALALIAALTISLASPQTEGP